MEILLFMWNVYINIWWKFQWSTVISFSETQKNKIYFLKKRFCVKIITFLSLLFCFSLRLLKLFKIFNFHFPKVPIRLTFLSEKVLILKIKACFLPKKLLTICWFLSQFWFHYYYYNNIIIVVCRHTTYMLLNILHDYYIAIKVPNLFTNKK